MFHHTLARQVKDASDAIARASSLLDVLARLDAHNVNLGARVREIADGSNNRIVDNANALHSEIVSLPQITANFSARTIFREVENLSVALSFTFGKSGGETEFASTLLSELDTFAELYNTYVAHPTGPKAHNLLVASSHLRNSLLSAERYFEYTRCSLEGGLEHSKNESEFSLVLMHVVDLRDFAHKVAAVQDLYDELAAMLNVSTATSPLRIGKVESGSLLTRLFGDTKIVDLMVRFIESAARFVHRNYTKEGKLSAIPGKVESLEAILELSNRLKESGVDVADLQSSLAKNAVHIAESLSSLVADQPEIEVNGTVIKAGQEVHQALLEKASAPRLTYAPAPREVPGATEPQKED